VAVSDLASFRGQWFVVKIGGELVKPGGLDGVAEAVRAFAEAGVKVCIVHGGGPQATALTERLGLTPVKIAGRRVTDEKVLQVMKMSLAGEVSVDVVAELRRLGVNAVGLHGISGHLIHSTRRPPKKITGGPPEPVDLGLVGDVHAVNVHLLDTLAAAGYVPAVASIGGDDQGGVFNINADVVASKLAAKVGAAKLLLVSGVPGVMRDPQDPATRIPKLTPVTAKENIDNGIITGGMIPKVEEALSGLAAGIGAVHVCGSTPGSVLSEAREPGSTGTAFLPA
jgi:acetylglutamate kinase